MELIIVGILGLLLVGAAIVVLGKGGSSASRKVADLGRFERKPLLNRFETQLLGHLDALVPEAFGAGARVMVQVAYGEFLKGADQAAHARINQKRADFIVVGVDCTVLGVVEYQGAGHYGRGDKGRANAEARDKVKRHACASAGIRMIEIPAKFSLESVRAALAPPAETAPKDRGSLRPPRDTGSR